MKPITDDIILSLIERAERREASLHPANSAAPLPSSSANRAPSSGRIISLDLVRRRTRVRQTVSGVFCYAPRA